MYHTTGRNTVLWSLLALAAATVFACSGGSTVQKDALPGTDSGPTDDQVGTDIELPPDVTEIVDGDQIPDFDLGNDGVTPPDVEEDIVIPVCTGPGEFLCECEDNSDCVSGYCVESLDGQVCTTSCIEDCPAGWACVQDQLALPDVLYICLPQNVYLCNPCVEDGECNSPYAGQKDLCVSHGDNGSFCGVDCSQKGECPNGYVCAEVTTDTGNTAHQCVPAGDGGECTCSPKAIQEGATTPCKKANGYGECLGDRFCGPNGLTECSALEPKPEECNGIDDNCDGEIDPPNSLKCITWYYDQDGDGYGIGAGSCECEAPGPNYVAQGGDCDDSNVSIHPGVNEKCGNGDDDNCNGEVDEAYAEGCETMYEDADNDGYGNAAVTNCLCKEGNGWSLEVGDCNDANPNSNPEAEELCDGEDNNCDGVIDEENALGCVPYYLDQDKDGYGLTDQLKCLCAKIGDYTAVKGGDCDDTEYNVHPTVVELCDGVDNDCDGEIDEDEAVTSCGVIAHGEVACDNGCVIVSCEESFYDLNGAFADGCECQLEASEILNQTCNDAEPLGTLGDNGTVMSRTAKIVPATDSDWYKFTGSDEADPDGCDTYHVRVKFVKNPNDAYVMDVYLNGCAGADNLCSGSTLFEYYTDFFAETGQPGAPGGECPCMPDADHNLTPDVYNDDTSASAHQCTSQTGEYFVRVYRKDGAPVVCDEYQIEFSNGIADN